MELVISFAITLFFSTSLHRLAPARRRRLPLNVARLAGSGPTGDDD